MRRYSEWCIERLILFNGILSIAAVILIFFFLTKEGIHLFKEYSFGQFLFGKGWYPISEPAKFGILPLLLGSLWVTAGATLIAVPLGVASAGDFSIQSYSKAISLDPKNPANYVAVARVYVAQADLIDAQMRISGASNDLIQQRDAIFAKAELHLVKALELKNDFTPARFLLVQVFDREGKIVDAINRAFEIAQFNPDDVGSLFQLGFLYYKNGQFSESRIVLERAVGISPNYSNARYFLGLIYDRQGDRDSAIIQFVQIENLNPDNAEVKQILANLRAKKEALFGIVPPPQQRTEAPVREGAESPVNPVKRK